MNLPPKQRPKQKPITKVEASGDIVLASYPNLAKSASSSPITAQPAVPSTSLQAPFPLEQSQPSSRPPVVLPSTSDQAKRETTEERRISTSDLVKAGQKKQQPQQLLSNPKLLIPVVAVIISSLLAFLFFSGIIGHPQLCCKILMPL